MNVIDYPFFRLWDTSFIMNLPVYTNICLYIFLDYCIVFYGKINIMVKSKLKWYWKNYSTKLIRLHQFALNKMGLLQSRTVLKIENYIIICAPYQMSMKKAFLFVVLNKTEIPIFKK